MQALILSAGKGNRLQPLTNNIPKALVKINEKTILENSLDILARNGIEKTIIVIGYLGAIIKERIGQEWKGMKIKYIENKEYNETNNIYSLWLANEYLNEDTILMECDIWFEEELIKRLIAQNLENKVVVDFFKPGMDGTVVEINENNELKKLITSEEQDINFNYANKYKTVNVYLFTKDFLQRYFLPHLDLYIKTQSKNKYYELLLSIFINFRNPILKAVIINDIKWIEIDDYSDLRKAKILTYEQKTKLEKLKSIHGGYWRYDIIDFCYLYNLYFPPISFFNDIRLNLNKLIQNYPSCQKEIVKSVANWSYIEPEYLTVANGASELIRIINSYLIKKIAIPIPTFNEYESGLDKNQIVYFQYNPLDFSLDIKSYVKTIKENNCDAALLINPNNPTGTLIELNDIVYFLEELKNLDLIIIDESFIDFSSTKEIPSIKKYFKNYKNLLIIKSMGKELGILGVRLGYSISVNSKINEFIRKKLPIWNINSVAEYILEILPKYRNEYKESLLKIISDREYLFKELSKIDYLKIFSSQANFIFAELKKSESDTLCNDLFEKYNILIKDCSNKSGLEAKKHIRIAVRTKQDSDMLINNLIHLYD